MLVWVCFWICFFLCDSLTDSGVKQFRVLLQCTHKEKINTTIYFRNFIQIEVYKYHMNKNEKRNSVNFILFRSAKIADCN